MNSFLRLPASRRGLAFRQVDEAMGLQAFSVEKDFSLTLTGTMLMQALLLTAPPAFPAVDGRFCSTENSVWRAV